MPAVHVIDAFVLIAISRGEAGARLLKMGLPPAGPPPRALEQFSLGAAAFAHTQAHVQQAIRIAVQLIRCPLFTLQGIAMKHSLQRLPSLPRLAAACALALALAGCGYNDYQRLDEETQSAWSEVVNQYQRRSDLVQNMVNTVKGEANFEQETLTKVIEARAKATSIQVTPETLQDATKLQQFQAAQGELSSALSRLMVTVERYPDLKANQAFADLRVTLEGTENRITVARNRYIQAVQQYNVLRRSFPTNLTGMVFGYEPKQNFTVANEAAISTAPTVDFSKPGQ